jgi:FkbM family methyltransferase
MISLKKFKWSIKLDYILLLKIRGLSLRKKCSFIILKYLFFIKDSIVGIKAPMNIRVFNRLFFYNDLYGPASLERVYSESYHLKDFIKQRGTIIDVGAHIGQFSFFCSNYLGAERIVSIEPLKDCFSILRMNAKNPDDCINCAVSAKEGPIPFYVSELSSQHSSYIRDLSEKYGHEIIVPAKRLDDIIGELHIDEIDLLKIDTEGSEFDVLLSARGILHRCNTLLIEMSVSRSSAGNLFTVGNYLQDQGFKLAKLLPYSNGGQSIDGIFTKNSGSI